MNPIMIQLWGRLWCFASFVFCHQTNGRLWGPNVIWLGKNLLSIDLSSKNANDVSIHITENGHTFSWSHSKAFLLEDLPEWSMDASGHLTTGSYQGKWWERSHHHTFLRLHIEQIKWNEKSFKRTFGLKSISQLQDFNVKLKSLSAL